MGSPGGVNVWVLPHFVLPDVNMKNPEKVFVSHFWAVPQVKTTDSPNMQLQWEESIVCGMHVKVPIMTNPEPIEIGTKLSVDTFKKAKR